MTKDQHIATLQAAVRALRAFADAQHESSRRLTRFLVTIVVLGLGIEAARLLVWAATTHGLPGVLVPLSLGLIVWLAIDDEMRGRAKSGRVGASRNTKGGEQ